MDLARSEQTDLTELRAEERSGARRASWMVLLPLFLIAAVVLVLDRLSKIWILDTLGGPNGKYIQELIPGWLQFRYVENTGAAFGIFQGGGWVLAIIATVVIGVMIYAAPRIQQDAASAGMGRPALIGLALVLGGAIGNLIDRILYGFVVDFVEFYGLFLTIGDRRYQWAVFNVADSAISIGIVLLLVSLVFGRSEK